MLYVWREEEPKGGFRRFVEPNGKSPDRVVPERDFGRGRGGAAPDKGRILSVTNIFLSGSNSDLCYRIPFSLGLGVVIGK